MHRVIPRSGKARSSFRRGGLLRSNRRGLGSGQLEILGSRHIHEQVGQPYVRDVITLPLMFVRDSDRGAKSVEHP